MCDSEKEQEFQYYDYLERLENIAQRLNENYDKAILTLSGGAIFLSFTFIKTTNANLIHHRYLLYISWLLWSISILSVIIALWTSQHAYTESSEVLVKENDTKNVIGIINKYNPKIKKLTKTSGLCLIVGVLFFLLFAYKTIEGKQMNDEIKDFIKKEIQNQISQILESNNLQIIEKTGTVISPRKDKPKKKEDQKYLEVMLLNKTEDK